MKVIISCGPLFVQLCDVIVFQVCFTPNGVDMRMLQPCDAPLRRHFLPGVKVEYSVSPRQSAYRVQIHRIQVKSYNKISPLPSSHLFISIFCLSYFFLSTGFKQTPFCPTDPESAARSHLPLCFLPCKTAQIYHHGLRSVNPHPVVFNSAFCALYLQYFRV